MFVAKPVAFGSINFLPGFPSDSVYSCNPWKTDSAAGSCATPPTSIGRESNVLPAGDAIAQALRDVTGRMSLAGLGGCGCKSKAKQHHSTTLVGVGSVDDCGCGGSCGGCGSGAPVYQGDGVSGAGGGGGFHYHHHSGLGDFGVPDLATVTADPLGYLQSNAFPIVLGALVVYLIKKR